MSLVYCLAKKLLLFSLVLRKNFILLVRVILFLFPFKLSTRIFCATCDINIRITAKMENLIMQAEKYFGCRDLYKIFHIKENATQAEGKM